MSWFNSGEDWFTLLIKTEPDFFLLLCVQFGFSFFFPYRLFSLACCHPSALDFCGVIGSSGHYMYLKEASSPVVKWHDPCWLLMTDFWSPLKLGGVCKC